MTDREPILRTHALTKRFGQLAAVDGLSLTVRAGDIYGFLGLNGAGKTTTLRMLTGLLRPSAGSVEIQGETFEGPAVRRDLGAMVEGPAFFGRLTGAQNLRQLAALSGQRLSVDDARALLDLLGLGDAADRPASTYSLGMKQRLGIALALAPSPKVVILDEPTNGLDPRGIRDIRDLILKLNRERGLTFMISSHLLSEVEQICNRVAILRNGRLVKESPIEALFSAADGHVRIDAAPRASLEAAISRVIGVPAPPQDADGSILVRLSKDRLPELAKALHDEGASIRAIYPVKPTLEELFFDHAEGSDAA